MLKKEVDVALYNRCCGQFFLRKEGRTNDWDRARKFVQQHCGPHDNGERQIV